MSAFYFQDKHDQVQGPFSQEEMRAWYEAGYLEPDLMISLDNSDGPFFALAEVYPDVDSAFLDDTGPLSPAGGGGRTYPGEWYFQDKHGETQGPFTDTTMREWHAAGYFEPDLVIRNTAPDGVEWGQLQHIFPTMEDAFLLPPKGSTVAAEVSGGGGAATAPQQPAASQLQSGGAAARFAFPTDLPAPPPFRGVHKVYPSERHSGSKRPNRVAITDLDGSSRSAWDSPSRRDGGGTGSNLSKHTSAKVGGRNAVDVSLKTMDGLIQLLECEISAAVPADKQQRVMQLVDKLRREQDHLSKSLANLTGA